MCPSDCNYLIPYIVNLAIGALFVMIGTIPGLTVMLRIVKKEDKALALGIVSTLVITCSKSIPFFNYVQGIFVLSFVALFIT